MMLTVTVMPENVSNKRTRREMTTKQKGLWVEKMAAARRAWMQKRKSHAEVNETRIRLN